MIRSRLHPDVGLQAEPHPVAMVALIAANMLFNVVASACFKLSAGSASVRSFLLWQVAGNIAGLITVLALTALLRHTPLHVAYPVTMGLSVFGVQVLGARLLFHEAIPPARWAGTVLVVAGIALMSRR